MAAINVGGKDDSFLSRSRPGVARMKKHSLKTDMTPMVDLGFLLISFFVFTTELSKPLVTDLVMPKEGEPATLGKSNALTILLGKDNAVFYYHGEWDASKVTASSFSVQTGLGQIIREKQKNLDSYLVNGEGRAGLMLLIKPGPDATYKNVIDALDETLINQVKKYAIIKPDSEEANYLTTRN